MNSKRHPTSGPAGRARGERHALDWLATPRSRTSILRQVEVCAPTDDYNIGYRSALQRAADHQGES